MNEEIFEILQSYKNALENIVVRMEELEKGFAEKDTEISSKLDELNAVLYDEILNPAKDAMDRAEKEAAYNEWNGKYGEKFAPYLEGAKAVEGDDFDLAKQVYDNYNEIDEDKRPDMDVYVDAAVSKVAEELMKIKERLGAENIELKVDEDGETKLEVDGDEEVVDTEPKGEGDEENPVVDDEIVMDEEEEISDDPDELKAFEEELEKQLPKA